MQESALGLTTEAKTQNGLSECSHLLATSIIIPVYNEKGSVLGTVNHLIEVMEQSGIPCEIVLVDDGSTDSGIDDIVALPVKIIKHETNYGYGAALKTGILHSQHPIVVITDADGTYPIEEIPRLIGMMTTYDMVVGSRRGQKVHIPLIRRPAKWVITALASYLSGTKIPDLNSGLRAMRRTVVEDFLFLLPDGFSFTSTITLAMVTNNYLVHYEPINYHQRHGKSKIRPFYDTLNFTQLIIRTVTYFQPLKVFIPLSMALFAICFGVFILRLIVGEGFAIVMTVLFMSAVQIMGIGLLADMNARHYNSARRSSRTQSYVFKESDEA